MPPLIIVLHLESFKQWTLKGVQLVSDLFCLCACKNLEIWDSVSWGVFVFSFQIWQQAFRQWGWDVHIRRGEFCGVELRSAGSWWFAEVRGVAGKIQLKPEIPKTNWEYHRMVDQGDTGGSSCGVMHIYAVVSPICCLPYLHLTVVSNTRRCKSFKGKSADCSTFTHTLL